MISFILRRVVSGIVVLFVVLSLTFYLLYFSASNVARNILGEDASQAQVHLKEVELGLDQPVFLRYFTWLSSAIHGDFGVSWFTSRPVASSIFDRLPVTLSIVLVTILIVAIVSSLIGVTAAVRRGPLDRALQIVSIGGMAIPQFVVAIIVISIFAIQLRWFPATGYVRITDDFSGWVWSLVLPVVALAIGGVAATAQQVRSATIKVLGLDYVRLLRSRGLSSSEILFRHVLRGAAPAGLTVLSLQLIGMLGGVVVIEQIFALPGLGQLALQSTTQGDMPVLMGVVIYISIIVVAVNLFVDLAVGWFTPKARVS
jgi:peptide/nickel transport system permease protein